MTTQVYDIAERWSRDGVGILFDEENCDWLLLPHYPLPERWQQRRSPLFMIFPNEYPEVPPTGFYLRHDLTSRGADHHWLDKGYYGAPDLSSQGWWWYCLLARTNVPGGWKPSSDPKKSDNLWTYLDMVREALSVYK